MSCEREWYEPPDSGPDTTEGREVGGQHFPGGPEGQVWRDLDVGLFQVGVGCGENERVAYFKKVLVQLL